jgi:Probable zinc-ribbon domain
MEQKIEVPNFKTMILTCRECGTDFLITESEQLFMWRKGLSTPTHCQECRNTRRQSQKGGNRR